MKRFRDRLFREENGVRVKTTRFPFSLFGIYFGMFLLMSGIHQGLLVLMDACGWSSIIQPHVILLYWIAVALLLTFLTRKKIVHTYEIPLQRISAATKRVAHGDFSVYIPTTNTPDRHDYLDMMILDLNRMIEELGSIETLKTDFVSNVSHEMKTPIAVMKNAAQLLQMPGIPEDEKLEYAKNIEQAAGKLTDLITNILKLNKLENQKIVPQAEPYDVCRQLCDCVIAQETRWEEKELELDMDLEEQAFILADAELLELVWNNLLTNAIKFTEPHGTISVRQRTEREHVLVSVSDTGCGMREETVHRIFDRFYQCDTSHASEGNGLGLSLVSRVLQLSGGSIEVSSTPGQGSTFTVILPAADTGHRKGTFDESEGIYRV